MSESDKSARHCEAEWPRQSMDCHVAGAPRSDGLVRNGLNVNPAEALRYE